MIYVLCIKFICKVCDVDGFDICYLDKYMIYVSCLNKEKKFFCFLFFFNEMLICLLNI